MITLHCPKCSHALTVGSLPDTATYCPVCREVLISLAVFDTHQIESATLPPSAPVELATLPPTEPGPLDSTATLAPAPTANAPRDARAPEGSVTGKELGRGGMRVVAAAVMLGLLVGVIVLGYFGYSARQEAEAAKTKAEDEKDRSDEGLSLKKDRPTRELEATEVLSLKGHTSTVSSVAFSPDGKYILTGSWDGTAKVWDAEKGTEILSLKGHNDYVSSVAFSSDGKRILTGSTDKAVKVWDAEKGTEVLTLKGHIIPVESVAFSSDGKRLFAWDVKGQVLAWSAVDGEAIDPKDPPPLPHPRSALSPDGRLAKPTGYQVVLIDLLRPPPQGDPRPLPDAAERKRHHSEQAALAEKEKQWFAAAFHLGRLLLDDPDNADLKKRRDEAIQKHNPK